MNNTRKRLFKLIKEKGYSITNYIHSTALVLSKDIGEGSLIFENVVIGRFAKIGIGNIFYPCSLFAHHSTAGDFNFFAIASSVAGNVTIGNNCFIGNNATTKDSIKISDYTLIGAGSYIAINTEPYGVYVPAKSIKLYDMKSTDFKL